MAAPSTEKEADNTITALPSLSLGAADAGTIKHGSDGAINAIATER
jgi:hypothetical protein